MIAAHGLLLLAALLGPVLADISNEDLLFLSQGTNVSVDDLWRYQNAAGMHFLVA
jgi:hypothetical protein